MKASHTTILTITDLYLSPLNKVWIDEFDGTNDDAWLAINQSGMILEPYILCGVN